MRYTDTSPPIFNFVDYNKNLRAEYNNGFLNLINLNPNEFNNTNYVIRQGEKGEKGDKGDRGEKGESGSNGSPGINGLSGNDGNDGKDGVVSFLSGLFKSDITIYDDTTITPNSVNGTQLDFNNMNGNIYSNTTIIQLDSAYINISEPGIYNIDYNITFNLPPSNGVNRIIFRLIESDPIQTLLTTTEEFTIQNERRSMRLFGYIYVSDTDVLPKQYYITGGFVKEGSVSEVTLQLYLYNLHNYLYIYKLADNDSLSHIETTEQPQP